MANDKNKKKSKSSKKDKLSDDSGDISLNDIEDSQPKTSESSLEQPKTSFVADLTSDIKSNKESLVTPTQVEIDIESETMRIRSLVNCPSQRVPKVGRFVWNKTMQTDMVINETYVVPRTAGGMLIRKRLCIDAG